MTRVTDRESVPQTLKSVLIVEDNPDDAKLVEYILNKLKYRNPVKVVRTALEMMSYLDGFGIHTNRADYPYPALVLLDLMLPQMSGVQAQAWVRSTMRHRKIPLIVISSIEKLVVLRTAVNLGADAYMTKPFSSSEFERLAFTLNLPLERTNVSSDK